MRRYELVLLLPVGVILYFLLVLRFFGIIGFFKIPASSMEPNLKQNSYILTWQSPAYLLSDYKSDNSKSLKRRIYKLVKPTIKREDIVVFKYPEGDTISKAHQSNYSYYALLRDTEKSLKHLNKTQTEDEIKSKARSKVWATNDILHIPIFRRTFFCKRCIALPGDTLEINKGEVYINQKGSINRRLYNNAYKIRGSLGHKMIKECDITIDPNNLISKNTFFTTQKKADCINNLKDSTLIRHLSFPDSSQNNTFPYSTGNNWSTDFYGPIVVPEKGQEIYLTNDNLDLYRRIIETYENDKVRLYLNRKTPYKFKMDYYFVMGDNRHNSIDSRYWGFVPQNHMVGKLFFKFHF